MFKSIIVILMNIILFSIFVLYGNSINTNIFISCLYGALTCSINSYLILSTFVFKINERKLFIVMFAAAVSSISLIFILDGLDNINFINGVLLIGKGYLLSLIIVTVQVMFMYMFSKYILTQQDDDNTHQYYKKFLHIVNSFL